MGCNMSYQRFAATIATSTIVMFGLMYLNTYAWDHVRWSETRAYMAILMGATMAVIMLGFMLSMYQNMRLNIAIGVGAVLLFAGALWLVRSQATVQDTSYMRAADINANGPAETAEQASARPVPEFEGTSIRTCVPAADPGPPSPLTFHPDGRCRPEKHTSRTTLRGIR